MRLKTFVAIATLSLLPLTAFAGDKETKFKIIMNGKKVGQTSFVLKPSGQNFQLNTSGDYSLPASGDDPPTMGDYKRAATLSSTYDLIKDASTNEVGTSRVTIFTAPSGGKISMGAGSGGGGSSANVQLDLHPNVVVVPNFDAGAIEVLIRMRNKLPADAKMFAIIPSASIEVPVEVINAGSGAGTLANAPVATTHYTIKFPTLMIDAYADASMNLMHADFPAQHASFTRDGFVPAVLSK